MYYHISEFADSRNQIKTELRSMTKTVMNHLIKVFLYPKVQEQNHWKREIAQSLNDIAKQKGKTDFQLLNPYCKIHGKFMRIR